MMQLSLLWRPSLVRRVSMTLLLASLGIWAVLMGYYWLETGRSAAQARQRERGELILSVLTASTDAQARSAAAWYAALFNAQYQRAGLSERFVLQLQDRQGRVLFASRSARRLSLQNDTAGAFEREQDGEHYHISRVASGPWVLFLGEPAPDPGWLLARLSSNLTMSVVIAFPLLLLPIWLAVSRGMRPLRKLSALIAQRGPDDLSPLPLEVKDAELLPLAQALDRLLAQLRSKLSREHGFVQDAAHELRTPLAVIAAQAHVLRMADTPAQRQAAAQHLEDAIARASHLVRQLLELAHMDAAEAVQQEQLDLCQLIRQTLAEMAPLAMQGQIELGFEGPEALVRPIERHAFLSILHNLLSNALHYGREGGQVVVELAVDGPVLILTVTDDGPGIAPDQRALVFERFYRVPGGSKPGSGLGLSIVSEAAARLHGRVRLESGPHERGCRFIVELPLA